MGKKYWIIFLISVLLSPAFPLDKNRRLSQYSTRIISSLEGLPQTAVNAVIQGEKGYIWVASQGGVGRYDGVGFTIYSSKEGYPMRSDYVVDLVQDRQGRIWCGTLGAGLFWIVEGKIHHTLGMAGSFREGNIRVLFRDNQDRIWVGSDQGLFRYENQHFSPVYPRILRDSIRSIVQDQNGGIWIAGYAGGLHHWKEGELRDHSDGVLGRSLRSMAVDEKGRIWVGTVDRGIFRYDQKDWKRFGRAEGLPMNYITALLVDSDGVLWVGTMGRGIGRLRNGRFVFEEEINNGIKYVQDIFEDREGNIWISLYISGILKITRKSVYPYSTREGLSNKVVWSVFEDSRNNMWLGTNRGINRLGPDRSEIEVFDRNQGVPPSPIRSITEDGFSRIWAGTDGEGVVVLEGSRVVEDIDTGKGLPDNTVYALYCASGGRVWIGTANGLCSWKNDELRLYSDRSGLNNILVRTIGEDPQGNIWVGTEGSGLFRIMGDDIRCYSREDGLSDELVTSLYFDEQGNRWIGTLRGGLNLFRQGVFFQFRLDDGMFDNIAYTILEDGRENLWMSSNYGIYGVAKSTLEDFREGRIPRIHCHVIGLPDGMRNSECNGGSYPSGTVSYDGSLWFPTMEGAVQVDPEGILASQRPPPVIIEAFQVGPRTYHPRTLRGRMLKLEPGTRNIKFRFTAFHWAAPNRVNFKHQLEGFDDQWVDAGRNRYREYTNIHPGRYRFRVMATVNRWEWSENPYPLEFRVLPFFTQTIWFYLLVGLVLGLAVFGLSYLRVSSLKRRKEVLEDLVKSRTEELNRVNSRLRDLSRKDPLTRIANRREFTRVLDQTWRRCRRSSLPLSMIIVDIDFFKLYNDNYGHQQGDRCLQQVARVLAAVPRRPEDLTARYGGEEFVIILPDTDQKGARKISKLCLERIRNLKIPHEASKIESILTVSIGTGTIVPTIDQQSDSLIRKADTALYRAKTEGRNCIRSG